MKKLFRKTSKKNVMLTCYLILLHFFMVAAFFRAIYYVETGGILNYHALILAIPMGALLDYVLTSKKKDAPVWADITLIIVTTFILVVSILYFVALI